MGEIVIGGQLGKKIRLYNQVLFSHKEEWNYVIYRKMDGIGLHRVKWNKPEWERQILLVLSYVKSTLKKKKEWNECKIEGLWWGSRNQWEV
jgi:hypothetical protein